MKNILKKYNDFVYGYLLIALVLVYWTFTDFIRVQSDDTFSIIIVFLIFGFLISKLFYLLRWFKSSKKQGHYRILTIVLLITSITFGNSNFIKNVIIIDAAFILFGLAVLFLIVSWVLKYQKKQSVTEYLNMKKNWLIRLGLVFLMVVINVSVIEMRNDWANKSIFYLLAVPLLWVSLINFLTPSFFRKYRFGIIALYTLATIFILTVSENSFHYDVVFGIHLAPLPFIILMWAYGQWKWFQELKAEKSKAELALLKSQINPHFFFNTLNNLYGLTVEKSDHAPEVVLKLSEMMRYTIYEGKKDFVPLYAEFQYLKSYVELHQIRYQKNVTISFETSGQSIVEFESYKIAPLLFIILLENAFKHGVDSITEEAFVDIKLYTNGNQIVFNVENNYLSNQDRVSVKGIGLENLKKRLEMIYPQKHELKLIKTEKKYQAFLTLTIDQ